MGNGNEHYPLHWKPTEARRVGVLPLMLDINRLNRVDTSTWSRHPHLLFWGRKQKKTKQKTLKCLADFSSSIKWSNIPSSSYKSFLVVWVSDRRCLPGETLPLVMTPNGTKQPSCSLWISQVLLVSTTALAQPQKQAGPYVSARLSQVNSSLLCIRAALLQQYKVTKTHIHSICGSGRKTILPWLRKDVSWT